MSNVTRAVILAAGLGSRLKSLTHHQPKALMQLAGEPIIVHVIRQLVAQGIHDISINIHHHATQLRHYLGNGEQYHARLYFSHEKTLLNSGGGVRTALNLLPGAGLVAVHNADILSTIPLQQLARLCSNHYHSALALVSNPKHHPQGDFSLQHHQLGYKHHKHTFAGVSVWHDHVLQAYPSDKAFSLIEPIQAQIQAQQCTGLIHRGPWFDIGRHRDLVQANRWLSQC